MTVIIIKFVDGDVIEHNGTWKVQYGVLVCEDLNERVTQTLFPLNCIYRIDEMVVD